MAILSGLLNLVYPAVCGICGKKLSGDRGVGAIHELPLLCGDCINGIKINPPPYCKKCGRSLRGAVDSVEICWECADKHFHFERSWSAAIYEGAAKEALHLLKYSKKLSLAAVACNMLIQFIKNNPEVTEDINVVAAVPLYSVKFREREFNQAYLLAEAIAREFKIENVSCCLKRTVATRPQSGLDKRQRVENVRGTFESANLQLIREKNMLIIDDLFTTGATLNECAKVLKKAGARKVHCLTFARGI